jgi:hypothetical protein
VQKLFTIAFNPNQKKLMNFSEEKMISACMVTDMEAHCGRRKAIYTVHFLSVRRYLSFIVKTTVKCNGPSTYL